jgi:Uma2 family endonuclease
MMSEVSLVDHRFPFDRELEWKDLQFIPEDEGWTHELVDGTLMLRPKARDLRHQSCAASVAMVLRERCPPGLRVVFGPFAFTPHENCVLLPDVLLARAPVPEERLVEAPVLLVEVMSPDTRLTDTVLKKQVYAEHGVEHYWLVDPDGPSIEALRLVEGEYVRAARAQAGQRFVSVEPVAVEFDPVELLDE